MPDKNLTTVPFGKHKGRTFSWVALHDPDWLYWSIEEGIWEDKVLVLKEEAHMIGLLSQNIAIPNNEEGNLKVLYITDTNTGKFQTFEVVDASEWDSYSYGGMVSDVIDLSMPRKLSTYDKTGGRLMLSALKFYYYGDESYRFTEKRCHEFFTNRTHFDLDRLKKAVGI
ncbi:hypothetical protein H6777_04040 [Candidatus Nomurabacteria bacterium]|nr:hypothetical protein [candidate division KSB1 bacterium]MCB9811280.1 hypothetical protein [Candidatus Nomurabacteria bacterium]